MEYVTPPQEEFLKMHRFLSIRSNRKEKPKGVVHGIENQSEWFGKATHC